MFPYVSYKDSKELEGDLKPIYRAATEDGVHLALESFETKWKLKHPQIAKLWHTNWANLIIFMQWTSFETAIGALRRFKIIAKK